jgi:hypothetical protein
MHRPQGPARRGSRRTSQQMVNARRLGRLAVYRVFHCLLVVSLGGVNMDGEGEVKWSESLPPCYGT